MTVGNMESVQLFDAGNKGRGLRATRELNTGEVVFAEPSFSAVVFDRYVSPWLLSFQARWTCRNTGPFLTEHVTAGLADTLQVCCGLLSRVPPPFLDCDLIS